MRYRPPNHVEDRTLRPLLAHSDASVVVDAIIDGASFSDPEWMLEELLTLCRDRRPSVARAALLGIGTLAQRRVLVADRRVWIEVLSALESPGLASTASDVLEDLEMFGQIGKLDVAGEID